MSPDSRSAISLAKTLCFLRETFDYETLEQQNGNASVIKFPLEDPQYNAGDVLVIMDADEIVFHGMIGQIADGFAIASDKRASLLPATVQ